MLDTSAGETFMEKEIEVGRKLLNDMQHNHAQWHIERTNTKKVNAVTEVNNEELTTKVDELITVLKGKNEAQVNAIYNAKIEEINFVDRNTFNPGWKCPNFGSNYQKPYNPTGAPNNSYGAQKLVTTMEGKIAAANRLRKPSNLL